MNRIRKGDQVIVIAGSDKGKKGQVTRVAGDRVFVENIKMVKRHTKPNPQAGIAGGIVEKEAPIHISNVAHVDPDSGRPTRVGYRLLDGGRKVRFAKRSGEVIDR